MKKIILTLMIFVVSFMASAHNGDTNVECYANGAVKSKVIKHKNYFELIRYYENGNILEDEFFDLNKNKTGCWIRYSENGGIIGEANFKNDKKDGDWKIYNEKGQMTFYIKYKNGKKETISTWNENQGLVIR